MATIDYSCVSVCESLNKVLENDIHYKYKVGQNKDKVKSHIFENELCMFS